MSSSEAVFGDKKMDICEALFSLIKEGKEYESIVVQDIIKAAGVGRATFYAYFAGKDDVLISCVWKVKEVLRGVHEVLSPSCKDMHERIICIDEAFFTHAVDAHEIYRATRGQRVGNLLENELTKMLGSLNEELLQKELHSSSSVPKLSDFPKDLVVSHITSAYMTTFEWWLKQHDPLPAQEVTRAFRALMIPTLRSYFR